MKKYLLIASGCVLVAFAVFAQTDAVRVWSDYLGLHIGSKATEKIGFYGKAPVVRQTITNTAPIQIQVVAVDGSTNTIAVYTTTNQLNQVRNTLVNLGLASTTGQ